MSPLTPGCGQGTEAEMSKSLGMSNQINPERRHYATLMEIKSSSRQQSVPKLTWPHPEREYVAFTAAFCFSTLLENPDKGNYPCFSTPMPICLFDLFSHNGKYQQANGKTYNQSMFFQYICFL